MENKNYKIKNFNLRRDLTIPNLRQNLNKFFSVTKFQSKYINIKILLNTKINNKEITLFEDLIMEVNNKKHINFIIKNAEFNFNNFSKSINTGSGDSLLILYQKADIENFKTQISKLSQVDDF